MIAGEPQRRKFGASRQAELCKALILRRVVPVLQRGAQLTGTL